MTESPWARLLVMRTTQLRCRLSRVGIRYDGRAVACTCAAEVAGSMALVAASMVSQGLPAVAMAGRALV